jgi:hypothetical protein
MEKWFYQGPVKRPGTVLKVAFVLSGQPLVKRTGNRVDCYGVWKVSLIL